MQDTLYPLCDQKILSLLLDKKQKQNIILEISFTNFQAVPAVLAVLEVAEEVGVGLDDGPFRAHLVILAAAWWAGHYRCPVRNCLNQCAG